MVLNPEDILKLVLAIAAGGAIGLERELHHKAAGFRTIILICMGATLVTILDVRMGSSGRIAANIVTGIGFLGAGVILHEENQIKGLTTAAAVWLSAALGIGIGSGALLLSLVTCAFLIVVMTIFSRFERKLGGIYDRRTYEITLPCDLEKLNSIENEIRACGLRVGEVQRMKSGGVMQCAVEVSGTSARQNQFVERMLEDEQIEKLEW
jgi:putative Mg2+ transporter-C (MgtC) family protein